MLLYTTERINGRENREGFNDIISVVIREFMYKENDAQNSSHYIFT